MGKTKIFTDSTSDLSKEYIEKNDITVIPLYVNFDEISYKDGVEITTEQLYEKVSERGKLPFTSAPSPSDFYDAFKPYIDEGRDILYIGLSSHLSSTLQNAHIAAKELPLGRIEIIDSLNVSLAIGLLVMKAVDYAKSGMILREIADRIRDKVPKLRVSFVIDTLEYLHKGGRCSGVQSFIGGVLKIRPIIKMENGKVILWEKVRGKREKAIELMLNKALKDKDSMDLDRVIAAHSVCADDAEFAIKDLRSKLKIKESIIGGAGCVISTHCGPKTVGIIYLVK